MLPLRVITSQSISCLPFWPYILFLDSLNRLMVRFNRNVSFWGGLKVSTSCCSSLLLSLLSSIDTNKRILLLTSSHPRGEVADVNVATNRQSQFKGCQTQQRWLAHPNHSDTPHWEHWSRQSWSTASFFISIVKLVDGCRKTKKKGSHPTYDRFSK